LEITEELQSERDPRVRALTARARELIDQDEYERAVSVLDEILKIDPHNKFARESGLTLLGMIQNSRMRSSEPRNTELGKISTPTSTEFDWYRKILYPAGWEALPPDLPDSADGESGKSGGFYYVRPFSEDDEAVYFASERPGRRGEEYDVRPIANRAAVEASRGIDDPQTAQQAGQEAYEARLKELREQLEADLQGGEVRIRNGHLVVDASAGEQELARRKIESLLAAMQPNVERGETLILQKALISDQKSLDGGGDGGDGVNVWDGNYAANGIAIGLPNISLSDSKHEGYADKDLIVRRELRRNKGQYVPLASKNLPVRPEEVSALGVSWQQEAGRRYAVVDEGLYRTLSEIAGRMGGARTIVENLRRANTIVGTDAELSNRMLGNVAYAGDFFNMVDVAGNPIRLPHEQYLLLADDGYITVVRTGRMQHISEAPAAVTFADAPQEIPIPRTGAEIKLEKTLIQPTDNLDIVIQYHWKGDK
jgi:hypothetical protein